MRVKTRFFASRPRMPTRMRVGVGVLACAATCCCNLHAQVREIVVIGSEEQKSSEAHQPVQSLSGDALLLKQSGSLGETLSGLPGVGATYFGGTASRPTLRGQDGDRVRIFSNGAALTDASSLSFDHAVADDPLGLEGVDIVRGASSLALGGAANAGVIQLRDNRIAAAPVFEAAGGSLGRVQLGLGTGNAERLAAAMVETGTDRYSLHVDAFDRKSSPVRVPYARTDLGSHIPNSQAQAWGAAVGGSWFLDGTAGRGHVGASLQSTRQHYGSPAQDDVTLHMQNARLRIETDLQGLTAWGGVLQGVSAHVVQHAYQHKEVEAAVAGTRFQSDGTSSNVLGRFKPFGVWGFVVATQAGWQSERVRMRVDGDEAFVPSSRTATDALHVLQNWNASWGRLQGAWRHERAYVQAYESAADTASGFAFASDTRRFQANSLALGGQFPLSSVWRLTGDLARGARIPKDHELYANGEHVATAAFEKGDANLQVERSRHIELGLQALAANKSDRASVQWFSTRYPNYIGLQSTHTTSAAGHPVYQYTAMPAHFWGWEWQANKRWRSGDAASPTLWRAWSWDTQVRWSYVQASRADVGQALPRIAPQRLVLDLKGKYVPTGAWGWSLQADHSMAQERVPVGDSPIGAYTLWHTALTYEQKAKTGRMLWFAKLDNITNTLAYQAGSILTQTLPGRVPLPGRTLRLGLQMSF